MLVLAHNWAQRNKTPSTPLKVSPFQDHRKRNSVKDFRDLDVKSAETKKKEKEKTGNLIETENIRSEESPWKLVCVPLRTVVLAGPDTNGGT